MDARLWFRQFQWDVDNPREGDRFLQGYSLINGAPSGGNVSNSGGQNSVPSRPAACASCPRGCKQRLASADSNEAVCAGTMFASIGGAGMFGGGFGGAKQAPNAMPQVLGQKLTRQANDLMHKYGLGHWQIMAVQRYIQYLQSKGVIGKDKDIDPDLPPTGTYAWYEAFFRKIALREGKFGEWAAEAAARMAESLGRYNEDVQSGNLTLTYWGTSEHYSSQVEVEWGFGSLLGERDLMLHMMANYPLHWMAASGNPYLTAEEASKLYAEAMVPYNDDRYLVDYGEEETGVYSNSKVKQVAWVKHYEKFWIGMGFCGWRWPQCITNNTADRRGATPNAEPKFWNAVTGKKLTFADCMEIGHKIYTLDRAIWILQGRTRDLEKFPDYVYDKPSRGGSELPMVINGQWKYDAGANRKLDRARVEDFKTRFYKFEGYGEDGVPTKATLAKMNMSRVAEALKSKGKLA
jgi:aldehyde:ferredoxin oxidoreductase